MDLNALKRQADDLGSDYYEDLEEAVKKRKMEGIQASNFPPILSGESMFTRAIPLGISNMTFCRSPSNHIGIYNSPKTGYLGDMRVSKPVSHVQGPPAERFDVPIHNDQKRPWRSPDRKPKDLINPYILPLLKETDLEFLTHSENFSSNHGSPGKLDRSLTVPLSKAESNSISEREELPATKLRKVMHAVPFGRKRSFHKMAFKLPISGNQQQDKRISLESNDSSQQFPCKSHMKEVIFESVCEQHQSSIIPGNSVSNEENYSVLNEGRFSEFLEYPEFESEEDQSKENQWYSSHVAEGAQSFHAISTSPQAIFSLNVTQAAEEILKYQFYLESGIDENIIAPMNERQMVNAVNLVGKHVIKGISKHVVEQTIQHVLVEVHHDYLMSMRKAIIDYIIQDEAEQQRLGFLDIKTILQVVSTSYVGRSQTMWTLSPEWRAAVMDAHETVAGILQRFHPLSLEIARIWQSSFARKYFVDVDSGEFNSKMPFLLASFMVREKLRAASVRESLEKDWFPTALALLKQAVPSSQNTDVSAFYHTVLVLINNQIRKLVEDSITSFTRFLISYKNPNVGDGFVTGEFPEKYEKLFGEAKEPDCQYSIWLNFSPPFIMNLRYINAAYSLEPSFQELEEGLLELIDCIVIEGSGIAFPDIEGSKISKSSFSSMRSDDELVETAKRYIHQVVRSNADSPKEVMKKFDQFEDLANLDAEAFGTEFKFQEKNLSDYEATLNVFLERASEVEMANANEVDCGFVRIQCMDFKGFLCDKAKRICTLLKEQILVEMSSTNQEVVSQCEHIARDITKGSTNSEEAVNLRKQVLRLYFILTYCSYSIISLPEKLIILDIINLNDSSGLSRFNVVN